MNKGQVTFCSHENSVMKDWDVVDPYRRVDEAKGRARGCFEGSTFPTGVAELILWRVFRQGFAS